MQMNCLKNTVKNMDLIMKNFKKGLIVTLIFFTQCTYKPVIDTAGRSGTFNDSNSENLTNDLIICKKLAKDNTNQVIEGYKIAHNWLIRPQTLWLIPKMNYKEKKLIKNCLTNRGHSVID